MRRVIIADTSCLIVLDNIGQIDLLNKLYGEILITPEVESEFGKQVPEWLKVQTVSDRQKQNILVIESNLRFGRNVQIASATLFSVILISNNQIM